MAGHFPLDKHLENQPDSVREWIISRNSDSTKKNYILAWEKFAEWVNIDGDEILKMREEDFTFLHTDKRRWRWEDKVKAWYVSLYQKRDPPKPTGTDEAKFSAIKSFFSFHRMKLNYRRGETLKGRRSTKDYFFKLVDIEAMKAFANPKEKWVLLGGKSLGLRAEVFAKLRRVDIEPYLTDDTPIPLTIQTNKKNVIAHPCIDRDAKEALLMWLSARTDDSPYILPGYKNKHIDPETLTQILRKLADSAHRQNPKICPYKERGERLRFHKLRTFLNSELQIVGVDKDLRDAILGHKLSSTTAAYTSEEYRTAYLQAINKGRLVLSKKGNEEHKQIQQDVKTLKDVIEFLMKDNKKVPILEERVKTLEGQKDYLKRWLTRFAMRLEKRWLEFGRKAIEEDKDHVPTAEEMRYGRTPSKLIDEVENELLEEES